LRPNSSDGVNPFYFNTDRTHTTGNLLEVRNFGTNEMAVNVVNDATRIIASSAGTNSPSSASAGFGTTLYTTTGVGISAGEIRWQKADTWDQADNSTKSSIASLNLLDNFAVWPIWQARRGTFEYLAGSTFHAADPMGVSTPLNGRGDGIAVSHISQATAGVSNNSPALIMSGDAWNPAGGPAQAQNVQAGWWLNAIETAGIPSFKVRLSGGANYPSTPTNLFQVTAEGPVILRGITKAEKTAIGTPENGMLVYQTDNTPGLRAYVNGAWVIISTAADP
jgi:hypothetical protein